jgi:peptidoglycan hydrolase CwlO-like protein
MPPTSREERIHQETVLARDIVAAQHSRDLLVQTVRDTKTTLEELTARLPLAEAEVEAAELLVQERQAVLHAFRAAQSQENRLKAAREARDEALRRAQEEEAQAAQAVVAARERQIEATERLAVLAGVKKGE